MPTIVHFEIPSSDIERSKKFYNDLFGWKFDKFPSPPGSKMLIKSSQTNPLTKKLLTHSE